MSYPLAALLTLVIEVPLYLFWLGELARIGHTDARPLRRLIAAAAANVITHPVLWTVVAAARPAWQTEVIVIGELVVIVVETGVLASILPARWSGLLLAVAAVTNAASWLIGVAVATAF